MSYASLWRSSPRAPPSTSGSRRSLRHGRRFARAWRARDSDSSELGNALRDRRCRVYSSDVRVLAIDTDLSTYPHVSVVCGGIEVDREDGHEITNPVLIIEVLSDSSEAYDRGGKFAHYRRLHSLSEYVLVSQKEPHIEAYRRSAKGTRELFDAGTGQTIELMSIGSTISVDEIYRDPFAACEAQ